MRSTESNLGPLTVRDIRIKLRIVAILKRPWEENTEVGSSKNKEPTDYILLSGCILLPVLVHVLAAEPYCW